ncbi:MAG: tRNA pseudouridine(55) synthase TruB [Ectothiorhodospiraceae bacterium AqS1]|nr:tRNA pseudouridine(55) synthase TruB [Ectothiorhodospiraceae bacterium AqS1]
MARRQRERGRPVHGILVFDKPVGKGSNEVLQAVKRLYRARKAGHTGSLDRLASGLLPICFGDATRLSAYLLNADKRYVATFRLGVVTTTGDAEGEIRSQVAVPDFAQADIERAIARFRGEIEQIPPMYSALKHKGKRLYQLAHEGIEIERAPRRITIHAFDLKGFAGDRIEVEVLCTKGTYIRTLAEDLGDALGCGASVERLRRIGAGPFTEGDMTDMATLESLAIEGLDALDTRLQPMESAVAHWPCVPLTEGVAFYLRKGQPVLVPHAPTQGWVRLHVERTGFIGVGEVLDDGRIAPRRLLGASG